MRRRLLLPSMLLACTPTGPAEHRFSEAAHGLEERVVPRPRSESLRDVVQIEAAEGGTCALTSTGTVYCWGLIARSDDGPPYVDLFGRYAPRPVEVAVDGEAPITRIAMGTYALAAIDASGRLLLAGDFGLPVVGEDVPRDTPFIRASRAASLTELDPARIFFKPGREDQLQTRMLVATDVVGVKAISAHGPSLCWLDADDVEHCNDGEPGFVGVSKVHPPGRRLLDMHAPHCVATSTRLSCEREAPRELRTPPGRLESDGRWETCVLSSDRSLACSRVEEAGPFVDIALAIQRGEVCGAPGGAEQVRCYSLTEARPPISVLGTEGVVELAAGTHHVCGRRDDGTVVCWGLPERGRLGTGTVDGGHDRVASPVVAPAAGQAPRSAWPLAHPAPRGVWLDAR